jgi:FkbH-like protein
MSTDYSALTREIRTRAAGGDRAGARERLRIALLRGDLDATNLERAARLLASVADPDSSRHEVLVLGQCTTSWVTQSLPPLLLSHGVEASAVEGQYDNVMQELMAREAAGQRPRVVVLVPWKTRLLADTGVSLNDRVAEQMSFWKQCWSRCHEMGSSVVQIGYDWTRTGPLGLHLSAREGDIAIIREMNRMLRESMPAGGYFLDLETVAGQIGRRQFYDSRQYHWTKQPFSSDGCLELGRAIASSIRAILNGPRKVLVLDLDNTVWGGVVGETGPLGVDLGDSPTGEAYRAFQSYVKQLSSRGVLLAVASKNNPDDAREPFTSNPAMQLSLDDIAAFEASWDPKEAALRRIAKALNLGTDSLVFFDDNPAEREHIRQALPEVAVPEVPDDPADYIEALERGSWFEAVGLTEEDRVRSSQYQQERKRRDLESSAGSMGEYLDSLEMVADVREISEEDMPRVVQLIGKTNQFNLTTRRHSESQVREILSMPRSLGFTIRLADRFGDHGLIAVVIGRPSDSDPMTLLIDTWLMSCRVIGRTTEEFTLQQILERSRRIGYRSVVGEYIPTRKNMLVQDLLPRLGFAALTKVESESQRFSIATDAESPASHIKALAPTFQC